VWDRAGRLRLVNGPHSSLLFQQEIMPLSRYTALPTEYIRYSFASIVCLLRRRVEWKDGKIEHIPGPATLFEDPLLHNTVRVEPGEVLGPRDGILLSLIHSYIYLIYYYYLLFAHYFSLLIITYYVVYLCNFLL
jgi:hypothetical protein